MECIPGFNEHTGRFLTCSLGGCGNADEIRALLVNFLHVAFRQESFQL